MKLLLLKVHNDIVLAIDNQEHVILVLLDLSAAFDMIDHEIPNYILIIIYPQL